MHVNRNIGVEHARRVNNADEMGADTRLEGTFRGGRRRNGRQGKETTPRKAAETA